MKTIIIHSQTAMKVSGTHSHGLCKPVVCIDNGDRYASVTDAAEAMGVSVSSMSCACNDDSKTCRGMRWSFAAHVTENSDMILDQTSMLHQQLEAAREKLAAQEAEMAELRAWKAEQERARAVAEKRRKAIESAKAHMAERESAVEFYRTRYNDAINKRNAARRRLAELEGVQSVSNNHAV